MRWRDLMDDAPIFADIAHQRLIEPGVQLVVTARADGSSRLSPVEPLILDVDLSLSMMWRTRKAAELGGDDRVLLHSIVTTRDGIEGQVKLRGQAWPSLTRLLGPATAWRSRCSDGDPTSRCSVSSESTSRM